VEPGEVVDGAGGLSLGLTTCDISGLTTLQITKAMRHERIPTETARAGLSFDEIALETKDETTPSRRIPTTVF
jgi:hypothetical protein